MAEYQGFACGHFAPQLVPVEGVDESFDASRIESGLIFYTPPGLKPPDLIEELRVPGNRFTIEGYFYLSGEGDQESIHPRFDLIGWKPLKPLQRWEHGTSRLVEDPAAVYRMYGTSDASERDDFEIARKYADC